MNQSRAAAPLRAPAPAGARPAAPTPTRPVPGRPAAPGTPGAAPAAPARTVDMSNFVDVTILGGFDAAEIRMRVADYDTLFVSLLAGEAMLLHVGLGQSGGAEHDLYTIVQPHGVQQIRRRSANPGRNVPMASLMSVADTLEKILKSQARQPAAPPAPAKR